MLNVSFQSRFDSINSVQTDRHSGFRRSGFGRSGLDVRGLDVRG